MNNQETQQAAGGAAPLRFVTGSWNDWGRQAQQVRIAVFVREQGVPPELEMDVLDPTCLHIVALDADNRPVATARLLKDDAAAATARIGRMAVLPAWRGRGVGAQMLDALLAAARARGDTAAVLSAQLHAQGFYAGAGFTAEGMVYQDAGIDHITMRKTL